jgi:hypothetical protein
MENATKQEIMYKKYETHFRELVQSQKHNTAVVESLTKKSHHFITRAITNGTKIYPKSDSDAERLIRHLLHESIEGHAREISQMVRHAIEALVAEKMENEAICQTLSLEPGELSNMLAEIIRIKKSNPERGTNDYNLRMRQRAIDDAHIGHAIDMDEAKTQGKAEGRAEERLANIRGMLASGISQELICKALNISEKDLSTLSTKVP